MKIITKEAGYLLSYSFSELEKNKQAYPIFFQITKDGKKKTKEFFNFSLEESIDKVISLVEAIDDSVIGGGAIFPVETKESKKDKLSPALMSIITTADAQFHLLQRYKFDKNGKLILEPYKAIYKEGLLSKEVEKLEKYYYQGIMEYKDGRDIWLRSFS